MTATIAVGSFLPTSPNPVSTWLTDWVRERRGRPKETARTIGCTHHAIYQRVKTNAAWTADDLARVLAADPRLEAEFRDLVKEIRTCTSA